MYKLARDCLLQEFTGISSRFDRADDAELILKNDSSIEDNVNKVINYLKMKELI